MTFTDSGFIDRLTELQINRGQPPGRTIKVNAAFFTLCYDNNSHKAGMSPEKTPFVNCIDSLFPRCVYWHEELMIEVGQQHLLSVTHTLLCLSSYWLQNHQEMSTRLSNQLVNYMFNVNTAWWSLTPSLPLGPSAKIRWQQQASLISAKKMCCFAPKCDLLMLGHYRSYEQQTFTVKQVASLPVCALLNIKLFYSKCLQWSYQRWA